MSPSTRSAGIGTATVVDDDEFPDQLPMRDEMADKAIKVFRQAWQASFLCSE